MKKNLLLGVFLITSLMAKFDCLRAQTDVEEVFIKSGFNLTIDTFGSFLSYEYISADSMIIHNVWYYMNGVKRRQTTYINGKTTGQKLNWYENGQLWRISWYVAGCQVGSFREWYMNGNLKKSGSYLFNTKRDTIADSTILLYEDLTQINRHCKDSFGNLVTIREMILECSLKHGKWHFYNEEGELVRMVVYDFGEIIREEEYR